MKVRFFVISLWGLLFFSCEEEGESNDTSSEFYPTVNSYNFLEQEAKGIFAGDTFTLVSGQMFGKVYPDTLEDGSIMSLSTSQYYYHLYANTLSSSDSCNKEYNVNKIIIQLPSGEGLYELDDPSSQWPSSKVTFYTSSSSDADKITNFGAVQIDSFSLDSVYGKIDAKFNDANYINGSFVLPLCENE